MYLILWVWIVSALSGCGMSDERRSFTDVLIEKDDRILIEHSPYDDFIGFLLDNRGGYCNAFVANGAVYSARHCSLEFKGKVFFQRYSDQKKFEVFLYKDFQLSDVQTYKSKKLRGDGFKIASIKGDLKYSLLSVKSIKNKKLSWVRKCSRILHEIPNEGILLHDCDTVKGSSGSPLLSNGKVIGIHLGFHENIKIPVNSYVKDYSIAVIPSPSNIAVLLNNLDGADLFQNKLMDRLDFEKKDYCTLSPDILWTPECGDIEIWPACRQHDICYETSNETKMKCDNDFVTDLQKMCVMNTSPYCAPVSCLAITRILYQGGVKLGGGLGWSEGRRVASELTTKGSGYLLELTVAIDNCPDGFQKLSAKNGYGDLNKTAGGEYVYFCYKKGEGEGAALTSINYAIEGEACPDGYKRHDVDLNAGAGGLEINLCTKKGELGKRIKDLRVTHSYDRRQLCGSMEAIDQDLNDGTSGQFIYTCLHR